MVALRRLPIVHELDDTPTEPRRPRTRADCRGHKGPCPWVSCKWHLYLEVSPDTGAIKLNFPDVEPDQLHKLAATCALDVADQGGLTLEEVGTVLGVTRERVRQIEAHAMSRLLRHGGQELRPYFSDGDEGDADA